MTTAWLLVPDRLVRVWESSINQSPGIWLHNSLSDKHRNVQKNKKMSNSASGKHLVKKRKTRLFQVHRTIILTQPLFTTVVNRKTRQRSPHLPHSDICSWPVSDCMNKSAGVPVNNIKHCDFSNTHPHLLRDKLVFSHYQMLFNVVQNILLLNHWNKEEQDGTEIDVAWV